MFFTSGEIYIYINFKIFYSLVLRIVIWMKHFFFFDVFWISKFWYSKAFDMYSIAFPFRASPFTLPRLDLKKKLPIAMDFLAVFWCIYIPLFMWSKFLFIYSFFSITHSEFYAFVSKSFLDCKNNDCTWFPFRSGVVNLYLFIFKYFPYFYFWYFSNVILPTDASLIQCILLCNLWK